MTKRTRYQGPVIRRQGQVLPTTTDQRLLESRGDASWVHADPWRVLRIQSEFVEGFGTLAELGPAVGVFGSARTKRGTALYATGVEIGRALAEAGFAVITGGGPGQMEAVNKGAMSAGGVSVGLGIELPGEPVKQLVHLLHGVAPGHHGEPDAPQRGAVQDPLGDRRAGAVADRAGHAAHAAGGRDRGQPEDRDDDHPEHPLHARHPVTSLLRRAIPPRTPGGGT